MDPFSRERNEAFRRYAFKYFFGNGISLSDSKLLCQFPSFQPVNSSSILLLFCLGTLPETENAGTSAAFTTFRKTKVKTFTQETTRAESVPFYFFGPRVDNSSCGYCVSLTRYLQRLGPHLYFKNCNVLKAFFLMNLSCNLFV